MSKWPMVPLGKVLQQDTTPTPVYADQEYPNFGIYSFGRGLFAKPPISGATTSAKTLYRVKAGQFIYSRLFAFEGAYGVVGEEFDGCFISNEYPHFDCDPRRLSARYLAAYLRWPTAWERAATLSTGMGDRRRRIQPEQLMKMEIPLPPMSEQQRIVEWIDAVATRVEEAHRLRTELEQETPVVFASRMNDLWKDKTGWQTKPIGDLASTVSGQVDPTQEPYSKLPHINGESIESGTCRLLRGYRTAEQDEVISGKYHFPAQTILYSKIRPYLRKAVEVPFEGVCSADIYAFAEISPEVAPRFLMYSLVSPEFTAYANELSGRTRMPKLNQNQLFRYKLPYLQEAIVDHLDKLQQVVMSLRTTQAGARREATALLPAAMASIFGDRRGNTKR